MLDTVNRPCGRILRVLYLGANLGTSLQRANAMRRLGHEVSLIDPNMFLPNNGLTKRVVGKLIYELGGHLIEPYVRKKLIGFLRGEAFDLVWVNGGELFGPETIRSLRAFGPYILNYNNDDPFGFRDRSLFLLYRAAVPEYDLLVVLREINLTEAKRFNAKHVICVPFSADEVEHAPFALIEHEKIKWVSDVIFVGTWMPERGPFLARLIKLGVPLKIYGDRWHKADEWEVLKMVWKGPNLIGGDYVKAIQCAKISLGLLSKGNRDLHTTRSAEIPYIGSVLCAERTSEHESMYLENEEAVFWSSPEECAEKCFWLLENPDIRNRIAQAGREKCIANGMLNEVVMKKILATAMTSVSGDLS